METNESRRRACFKNFLSITRLKLTTRRCAPSTTQFWASNLILCFSGSFWDSDFYLWSYECWGQCACAQPKYGARNKLFRVEIRFVKNLAAKLGRPVELCREFQSRDTQKVFETRTSTFDQMKAEDGARAQSPSMVHETNYFGSKFEGAWNSEQS